MNNAKIGAAVLAGYLLGRTKKAKLAMSLGAMLAGSRMRPGQLNKLLQDSPLVGNVSEQVRTELADAGKAAATTLLSAKAESLADALHDRTTGLKERTQGGGGRGSGAEEGDREGRDEEPEDEEEKGEEKSEEKDKEKGEGRRGGAPKSQESQSAGRGKKAHQRGSDQGGEPRKKKEPAAQSRAKSGSARSRRPDDD
ncbi:ABC transporter substrate-binding protein [Streptomyces sp. NPDC046931]|uniref:ABC transporter substrate-binding protein n=1 Tax=Streptomyces sp. NPDC046931 TaxID=3154806 RepID=UPI0033CCD471